LPNIKLWPNKQVHNGATLSRFFFQEEKWMGELFTDARISGISNIEIHPEFEQSLVLLLAWLSDLIQIFLPVVTQIAYHAF
jgi:hypothetical protein